MIHTLYCDACQQCTVIITDGARLYYAGLTCDCGAKLHYSPGLPATPGQIAAAAHAMLDKLQDDIAKLADLEREEAVYYREKAESMKLTS